MIVESSQDILYIVLAFSVLWFTAFLCWLLYQAARVLRNANRVIETVTDKLELINDAVQYMRMKIDGVSKNMGMVSSMMAGMAERFVVGRIKEKFEEKVAEKEGEPKKKRSTRRKSAKK